MSIQSTTHANPSTQSLVDAGDPEAMAMALAVRDAQKSRKDARARKQDAYQDRIQLLQCSANKLRHMAGCAIGSGIWRGVTGAASSLLGLSKNPGAACLKALSGASAAVDPYSMRTESLKAEQKQLEIEAEAASQAVSRYEERASEASRFENAVKQQLDKLHDKRAAAMDAAVRV